MTEQQYTCPFCHKDYTRFTIHEHYGCGVEPLETVEVDKLLDQGIDNERFRKEIGAELLELVQQVYGEPTETEPNAEVTHPEQLPQEEMPKVEPKYTVKASDIMESALIQAGFSTEDAEQKAKSEEMYSEKPEPKKRGRKPKAK